MTPLHLACELALKGVHPNLWHETKQLGDIVHANFEEPLDNERTVSCKVQLIVFKSKKDEPKWRRDATFAHLTSSFSVLHKCLF